MEQEKRKGLLMSAPATIYVAVLIVVPLGLTLLFSVWTQTYVDIDYSFSFSNYKKIIEDPLYFSLISRSLGISGLATICTVLLAYPVAYFIAFRGGNYKGLLLLMVTVPFWTSYLLRVFSWKLILGYNGLLNSALEWLNIIDEPLEFLIYNANAVVVTLAHAWAPFAILPIFVALDKIDRGLLEAATDLGDGPIRRFFRVTLPLTMPGIIGASVLVFIPTIGDYITPALVGGSDGRMVANLVQAQFGTINDWPMGAALGLTAMVCAALVAAVYSGLMSLLVRGIR